MADKGKKEEHGDKKHGKRGESLDSEFSTAAKEDKKAVKVEKPRTSRAKSATTKRDETRAKSRTGKTAKDTPAKAAKDTPAKEVEEVIKPKAASDVIVAKGTDLKTEAKVLCPFTIDPIRIRNRLAGKKSVIVDYTFCAAGSASTLNTNNANATIAGPNNVVQFLLLLDGEQSDHGVTVPIIPTKDGEGRWHVHYSTRFRVSNSVHKITLGWKSEGIVKCNVASSPTTDFATLRYMLTQKQE